MLSIGIVGLPNVGKSTLFEAVTRKQVNRQNYPFCTIDPNIGVVEVPDERLDRLAAILKPAKKIGAAIEFVDIAGLVKGAHQGQGLGNQFLAHIKETNATLYVLRAFVQENIINTQVRVDPVAEKEILDAELILKDLETANKVIEGLRKETKTGRQEAVKELEILSEAKECLEQGKSLSSSFVAVGDLKFLSPYQFLTSKPCFCVLNGSGAEVREEITKTFQKNNWHFLILDVLTELEAGDLSPEERISFGLPRQSGLNLLIKKTYEVLGLLTFFTAVSSNEIRAWPVKKGTKIPQAGGLVHSDFENYFIRAEVINWQDLLASGGFSEVRAKGLIRTEGKDYLVQDGDVIEIKTGK